MAAIIALFVVSSLLAGCGGNEKEKAATLSVTVYADSQLNGNYDFPYQALTVTADTAESYGYEDQIAAESAVSALDVLVAMHKAQYGEAFTVDTCNDYFAVDGGWISKAFGNATTSWSVILNGEAAHSEVTSEYGGYESLMISQTEVTDNDVVEVVAYQDTENYTDNMIWFLQDDKKINQLSVTAGAETTLTVKGYPFCIYASYGTEEIGENYLTPLAGVQLALLEADGSLTDLAGAVSDSAGTVTFHVEEAGTFTVVAYMPADTGSLAFHSALTVTAAE
ncbi:MAG TPA: hypothetical protein PKD52_05690 [Clostridiales bacterium]|nr:hypothetical protein [Clostridiales bacterium]